MELIEDEIRSNGVISKVPSPYKPNRYSSKNDKISILSAKVNNETEKIIIIIDNPVFINDFIICINQYNYVLNKNTIQKAF